MSILCIPGLKKINGTTEFAMNQNTGQLYTIGDIDVTPIILFGGILDEDFDGHHLDTPKNIPGNVYTSHRSA